MGYWAVELAGINPSGGASITWRFALGKGQAPTDVGHIPTGLARWKSPSQKIDVGANGVVRSTADQGEIVIANAANGPLTEALWDDGVTYAWQDRTASLYWVPGTAWSGKTLVAQGLLQQPTADLGTLRFPLKDPRASLDAPLQTTLYLGNNVAPNGVEGAGDLKGKPRPILYGVASNRTPDCVNTSKLIYDVADKAVTILCVRDGGVPLTAGTSRANVASLESNTPAAGTYDYTSTSTGTYIRLGSTPVYGIKIDAQEGATAADRTHAQIWKRIRTERCGTASGDIHGTSVTDTDTADGNEVGFWFVDGESRRDALDKVLASLVGYEVLDLSGDWHIGRLTAPSGSAAFSLVQALAVDVQATTDRALISLERTRPGWERDGSPPFRVNVRWGRNHSVMQRTDFAGSAAERLKIKFATEWRVETATDTTIWNPSAGTGNFPNAPELTIDTGYQPGADNLTCPHAATRATALLTLFSGLKGQYVVSFLPEGPWTVAGQAVDDILPGNVVQLTYARFGMDSGPLFRILQSAWVVEDGKDPKAELVIGLQT